MHICMYVCMYIHIYLSDEAMMAVKDGVRWGMRVETFAQVCVRGNMYMCVCVCVCVCARERDRELRMVCGGECVLYN